VKTQSLSIICTACGADTFVRREAEYEGFRKTGETITCVSCGHRYASDEEVPFKDASGPAIFTKDDLSKKVSVFQSDEKDRNCRHCAHYIVNPFIQRCGINHVEVQSTDLCERFEKGDEEES